MSTDTLARVETRSFRAPDAKNADQAPRWLKPGWPLAVLFVGYPLWWLLGLEEPVALALTVPMALDLARRPRIAVPRGFFLWLLFLVWVVAGLLLLQVDAPGAAPAASSTRYLTWTYRLSWYVACTVVLLYVGNNRAVLSAQRVCRTVGWLFVSVTVGGLLGAFLPTVDFPSLLEVVLPRGVTNQPFIHSLVHPTLAQIQSVLGHAAPRPSAPFSYANIWGLNYAVLLPFFVRGWLTQGAGWRRPVGAVILAASAVPMIYSLDRALWLALIAMAVFTAIRTAMNGRPAMMLGVAAAAGVVVVVLAVSSLGVVVQQRLAGQNSNQGRANLSSLTVRGVAVKSPIAGFGSTRNVQGNFNTIAAGATVDCPRCSPPALGTQGQLWLVTYSQGFVGLAFYLAFFLLIFFRNIRSRSPSASMVLAVLVASFITMPAYNALGVALYVIMIGVALLWREEASSSPPNVVSSSVPTLGDYRSAVRRQAPLIVSLALVGAAGGAGWQHFAGTPAKATLTVSLPVESQIVTREFGQVSIDTLGQLATPSGRYPHLPLSVLALPNTQILELSVTARDGQTASSAVTAAANAYLDRLDRLYAARRAEEMSRLTTRINAEKAALKQADAVLAKTSTGNAKLRGLLAEAEAQQSRTEAAFALAAVNSQRTRLRHVHVPNPDVIRPERVALHSDFWNVSITDGVLLGLLLGLVLAPWRNSAAVFKRPSEVTALTGLPVLAGSGLPGVTGSAPHLQVSSAVGNAGEGVGTVSGFPVNAFVAGDSDDHGACQVADRLDKASQPFFQSDDVPAARPAIVLVASPRTRIRALQSVQSRLSGLGANVVGVAYSAKR